MIVLDTSGMLAVLDRSEPDHVAATSVLDRESGPFVLSPFALAELDYLVLSRWGVEAELKMLEVVGGGAYDLAEFDVEDIRIAAVIVEQYADQEIGLADASIVVLAHRYRTDRVLTLDIRHFRALRTIRGRPFTILPEDDAGTTV